MANTEREKLFRADKLEDMCEKRSEEYQSIRANYEAWCVNQHQRLQAEIEELEDALIQLKKNLSDVDLEDSRATERLRQHLSRPPMHRDGSPDGEELFAKADKWHSELRRIRADRDRPRNDKEAILRDIERVQNKLGSLPAAYALLKKEETRRTREQLEDLWQQQSQSDSLTTSLANDDAQRRTKLLPGASLSAAEGFSSACDVHEQRNEDSRKASLETISSMEFRQSVFPSRASSPSLLGRPHVRSAVPNSGPTPATTPNSIPISSRRTSGNPMITPQHRLSQPSSNAAVFFRDHPGRDQAERATRGQRSYWATPQENSGPIPSPDSSRFGRVDTSFLPNIQAEGRHANGEPARGNRLELRRPRDTVSITYKFPATSFASVSANITHTNTTTGEQAKMRPRSQVSNSDSESDAPLAKRLKKNEKTVHFDQIDAANKNWKREKIYRITEYPPNSKRWYIFPCKKHCTGLLHAKGAAAHLGRGGHRHAHWTVSQAVKELGVRIINCDKKKEKRNNDSFMRAQEQGYRSNKRCNDQDCPLHGTIDGPHSDPNPGQRQQSEDLEDSDSASDGVDFEMLKGQAGDTRAAEVWQQPNLSPTALDPIPGELYQAYWTSERCWYPVTVLPWGDLREVGLVGSLDETDLFKEKLPTCFATEGSRAGLRIVGWKRDFELHGRRASERKFPCMFFEGFSAVLPEDEESPRQPVQDLAWVMVKNLRPIDYRHLDGQHFNEAGLDEAKAFRERVIVLKNKATRDPPRFFQSLVDDDSDDIVSDIREKPRPKNSTQPNGVKMEEDLEYAF